MPLVVVAGSAVVVTIGLLFARQSGGSGAPNDPIRTESIVMLGDSITAEGEWSALLPGEPVVNRGRSGFTTQQLVEVAGEVATQRPSAVFVLTGTNDIHDGRPPAWTVRHLMDLLDQFESNTPGTEVVVQTILPRSDAPDAVKQANDAIRRLVAERGVRLLDLHPEFDDGAGELRDIETTDGVHLSPVGYRRWADALAPLLDSLVDHG